MEFKEFWEANYQGSFDAIPMAEEMFKEIALKTWNAAIQSVKENYKMAKYSEVLISPLNRALCKADFGGTLCLENSDEYVTEAYEIIKSIESGITFTFSVWKVISTNFGIEVSSDDIYKFCREYYNPIENGVEIDESPLTEFDQFLFKNKLTLEQFNTVKEYMRENI